MEVSVRGTSKVPLTKDGVRRIIERTLFQSKKSSNVSLSVSFVPKEEIRKINKKYRDKNTVTDVLSFELREGREMGDIFICYDEVKKNSRYFSLSVSEELKRVVVHGILHLLGYDHEGVSDKRKREMLDLQEKIVDML